MQGQIFVDGSCDQHDIKVLKKASWRIVQTNDKGEVCGMARGVVPSQLPQSSQAGEFAAVTCALRFLNGPSFVFSDCAGVVSDFERLGKLDFCRLRTYG